MGCQYTLFFLYDDQLELRQKVWVVGCVFFSKNNKNDFVNI